MKFLGMQIMIEGLALGAFGTMYQSTKEPLLKELLRYVIQDEARHVHYGVLALKRHFAELDSRRELRQREDWTFEVDLPDARPLPRARDLRRVVRGPHEDARDWDEVMARAHHFLHPVQADRCSDRLGPEPRIHRHLLAAHPEGLR